MTVTAALKICAMTAEAWWWTQGRPATQCDECGADLDGHMIAFHPATGTVLCVPHAYSEGVALACKRSRRLREVEVQDQQLALAID